MNQTATKQQPDIDVQPEQREIPLRESLSADMNGAIVTRLSSLWKRRHFLQKVALIGLVVGAILAFVIPKRYESTTQLMPPDSQSNAGMAMMAALNSKAGGGLAPLAGDLLGMKTSGALFIGILRSRTVLDRLVEKFDLQKVYGYRYLQDARNKLSENTVIYEDRKSGIISIIVSDRDAKRAAEIARSYIDELNQLATELSTSSAHRERVFLEERLTAVKKDLDQASQDFSQFASKNKTLDLKEEARAMLQGAATIEGQLIAAESELRGLQAIYTNNNVRVRAVQGRIAELRHQMDKLGGNAPDAGNQPDSQSSVHPSLRNLPLLGVTYADLYRRMQIQETVYETLTQQYELAKVQEAKETPSVKVLDSPTVPERKSFPPRLLTIVLTGGLFLVGACLFVWGKERLEQVNPQEPGMVLAQEVLQSMNSGMPWATRNGSRFQAWTNRVWVRFVSGKDKPEESLEPKL